MKRIIALFLAVITLAFRSEVLDKLGELEIRDGSIVPKEQA